VKQEVIAGQCHVPSHPGLLKKVNINGNIFQRYFWKKRKSRGTNNCGQCVLEKKHLLLNVIFPHFQLFYFNETFDFLQFF